MFKMLRNGIGTTLMLAANLAHASVLFESASNRTEFSPSSSSATSSGWLVRDYRPTWRDATQFPAMPFSLPQDSSVTGAQLAITALAPWSANYSVQILPDEAGKPGAIPVWIATSLTPAPSFVANGTYSFSDVTGPMATLSASTHYWLTMSCFANCELAWWADTTNSGPGAIQNNSIFPYSLHWTISQDNAAMFRVLGTVSVVPESSTRFLLLVGLLFGLVSLLKRE